MKKTMGILSTFIITVFIPIILFITYNSTDAANKISKPHVRLFQQIYGAGVQGIIINNPENEDVQITVNDPENKLFTVLNTPRFAIPANTIVCRSDQSVTVPAGSHCVLFVKSDQKNIPVGTTVSTQIEAFIDNGKDKYIYNLTAEGVLYTAAHTVTNDITSSSAEVFRYAGRGNWKILSRSPSGIEFDKSIFTLADDPYGNLYAAGNYGVVPGDDTYTFVAEYNGSSWSDISKDFTFTGPLNSLAVDRDETSNPEEDYGDIFVAGSYSPVNSNLYGVAKYQPFSNEEEKWHSIGTGTVISSVTEGYNNYLRDLLVNEHILYTAGIYKTEPTGKRENQSYLGMYLMDRKNVNDSWSNAIGTLFPTGTQNVTTRLYSLASFPVDRQGKIGMVIGGRFIDNVQNPIAPIGIVGLYDPELTKFVDNGIYTFQIGAVTEGTIVSALASHETKNKNYYLYAGGDLKNLKVTTGALALYEHSFYDSDGKENAFSENWREIDPVGNNVQMLTLPADPNDSPRITSIVVDADGRVFISGLFVNQETRRFIAEYHPIEGTWTNIGSGPEGQSFAHDVDTGVASTDMIPLVIGSVLTVD